MTRLLLPLELDIPPPRPLHALYWQLDMSLTWVNEIRSPPTQDNTLTSTCTYVVHISSLFLLSPFFGDGAGINKVSEALSLPIVKVK
jgi:hypothetical protein